MSWVDLAGAVLIGVPMLVVALCAVVIVWAEVARVVSALAEVVERKGERV